MDFLPDGCSLRELDMLKELPKELKDTYDVVNLRLFMAAIKDDNPIPVLKNLIAMLSMPDVFEHCIKVGQSYLLT